MGFLDFLTKGKGHDLAELARRLGLYLADLEAVHIEYRTFQIPKRNGGTRTIHAPASDLKAVQRRINQRLLALLVSHRAATGFERGRSIVTNANLHVGKVVTVRMDIRNFFGSTKANRIHEFFRMIGWNRPAAKMLTRLCTHDDGLPQGAPTSPRLANLVNYILDARLEGMARNRGAVFTRYADDLCFSFERDDPVAIRAVIHLADLICHDFRYTIHRRRKLHIRRRHQRQLVTGLVVNDRVNLPRETRRTLRAVEHHLATGRPATLSQSQLDGWKALRHMIEMQRTM